MTTTTGASFKITPKAFFLIVAIILFVVAALGLGSKWGIDFVDFGLASFAAAFLFG
jgi:hypothetical protein